MKMNIDQLKELFDSWGIWWDAAVVMLVMFALVMWLEVVVGNRVRDKAKTFIGILLEQAMNWYAKHKNIAKARARHVANGKRYHVVIIGGRYYVINKRSRQRVNKILKKYHEKISFDKLIELAAYSTK